MAVMALGARQDDGSIPAGWVLDPDGVYRPFWWSRVSTRNWTVLTSDGLTSSQTGHIVKWSVFLGLTLLIGGYLLGGYIHAKKRLRKGLMPLAYHRVRPFYDAPVDNAD